jgi:hypothetical protein
VILSPIFWHHMKWSCDCSLTNQMTLFMFTNAYHPVLFPVEIWEWISKYLKTSLGFYPVSCFRNKKTSICSQCGWLPIVYFQLKVNLLNLFWFLYKQFLTNCEIFISDRSNEESTQYTSIRSHNHGNSTRAFLCLGLIFITAVIAIGVLYLSFPRLNQ